MFFCTIIDRVSTIQKDSLISSSAEIVSINKSCSSDEIRYLEAKQFDKVDEDALREAIGY